LIHKVFSDCAADAPELVRFQAQSHLRGPSYIALFRLCRLHTWSIWSTRGYFPGLDDLEEIYPFLVPHFALSSIALIVVFSGGCNPSGKKVRLLTRSYILSLRCITALSHSKRLYFTFSLSKTQARLPNHYPRQAKIHHVSKRTADTARCEV
jgi:hypothetical protein